MNGEQTLCSHTTALDAVEGHCFPCLLLKLGSTSMSTEGTELDYGLEEPDDGVDRKPFEAEKENVWDVLTAQRMGFSRSLPLFPPANVPAMLDIKHDGARTRDTSLMDRKNAVGRTLMCDAAIKRIRGVLPGGLVSL